MSNVEGRNSIDFINWQSEAIQSFDIPLGLSSSQAAVHYFSVLRFALPAPCPMHFPTSAFTTPYTLYLSPSSFLNFSSSNLLNFLPSIPVVRRIPNACSFPILLFPHSAFPLPHSIFPLPHSIFFRIQNTLYLQSRPACADQHQANHLQADQSRCGPQDTDIGDQHHAGNQCAAGRAD
jgi:hypothetical protein